MPDLDASFHRYAVWPQSASPHDRVFCYGRTAIEAAEEAFLDFVALDDPPETITLNCKRDDHPCEVVTVSPAGQVPFAPIDTSPELPF